MKHAILLSLIFCATQLFAQPKSYDYAYVNKKGICVYSMALKKEYFMLKDGIDPCISPDGTKLAYTVNLKNGNRAIDIIDLNTKAKTRLNTQNDNCYAAVWSPDGKWLAYNAFLGDKWTIAIIGAANTGPQFLGTNAGNCYSPAWLPDGKGIMVQDMSKVMVLDMAGNIVATYNTKEMEGGVPELKEMVGSSSSDKFMLAGDGQKIVFMCEVNTPVYKDGPPSAVFVYDTAGKKTLRLSPKGYDVNEVTLKNNTVLFTGYKSNSPSSNIYSVDMDGSNFKMLFVGCLDITARMGTN